MLWGALPDKTKESRRKEMLLRMGRMQELIAITIAHLLKIKRGIRLVLVVVGNLATYFD